MPTNMTLRRGLIYLAIILFISILCVGGVQAGAPSHRQPKPSDNYAGANPSGQSDNRGVVQVSWGGRTLEIDCATIKARGIDRQTNARAARIMAACGEGATPYKSQGGFPNAVERFRDDFFYGGTDRTVNDFAADTYPQVTQAESTVWTNGSTVVVHYNSSTHAPDCFAGISYSTDGGATFTQVEPNPLCEGHGTNGGDPTLVYNKKLGLWFASDLASGGDCGGYGIGLWTSPDGINWAVGACAHAGLDDDRQSHWVDNTPTSPFYGRQYISFNNYDTSSTNLQVIYSDNGVNWSAPYDLYASDFYRNVQMTGGPDGTVFVTAMDENNGAANPRVNYIFRSTNGGASWSAPISMGPAFVPPGDKQCTGYFRAISPIWRHMGWGQPAVGPGGVVHYVYAGAGTHPNDAGDIYYIRSTDNGLTWSVPSRLNTDNTNRPQWMPSLATTSSGALMASWYDRRDTVNFNYAFYGRASTDNGVTWQVDAPVSDVIMPQFEQPDTSFSPCFAGDYNYHTAQGDTVYLTWTDGRNLIAGGISHQDVGFDKVTLPVGSPTPSATPTTVPTACAMQFEDVAPASPFYPFVHCLACRQVMNGYPCGSTGEPCPGTYFRPNAPNTRGQLAKIVSISAGFNEDPGGQIYSDVPPGTTHYEYINRLTRRGIVSGYPCPHTPEDECMPGYTTVFRPGDPVTRGQT
ncbi:MAG TPA: S-layer homology domain-containing protein, partial [Chloroflexia bacterium]